MDRSGIVWDTYRQLYPADPAERRALNECFTEDPQFNRLDPGARAACFRHNAPMMGATAAPATTASVASGAAVEPRPQPAPSNFVDLWRAAGQGRMPQNDIRSQQDNYNFFHPAATAAAGEPAR
ncbi:MAG TPA: hypothetical protein VHY35_10120 [Stellaceae bacterium]|jgi:hypothetical protein|nr:hypothetical protein [Stellaceae bacterium]